MKRRIRLFITTLSALVMTSGLVLPGLARAEAVPKIYAQPAQVSGTNGGNVSVPIRVNPNGTDLDTVEIKVSFPEAQLTFQSVDKGGSAFDTFIPGAPKASAGSVEFSAAKLGNVVSGDSLVGTVVFTSKASSGSAVVDLTGSSTARNGSEVAATIGSATISFSANGTAANKVAISDVKVTEVTVNGGTISWKTTVPATSSVDYGSNTHYGFSAGTDALTTDHSVKLKPVFAGSDTVHFVVISRDAAGNTGTSGDSTFTTLGYTISILASSKSGKALSGASVRVGNSAVVKADSNGVATVNDVAPGSQKVVVNNGMTQFIAVKALNGAKAADVQKFELTAEPRSLFAGVLFAIIVLVAAAALITWLWKERAIKTKAPQTSD
jgi:hypothetical protein